MFNKEIILGYIVCYNGREFGCWNREYMELNFRRVRRL